MPIPDYQTVMLPLLKLIAQHGTLNRTDATQLIADEFTLTSDERRQLIPSGKCSIIRGRVGWARTYLKKAGLLAYPQRGIATITERGNQALASNLEKIDLAYLSQFPEFLDFKDASSKEIENNSIVDISQETPEEILESVYSQLKNQVLVELIEKIKVFPPDFFERLVIDTIVELGYGGSLKDAGQAIGRSGDEGIDGIINQDRLGLDIIYLQAKRWEANIGRPEIQKFAGALQGKRAKKGIFITTSDFTNESREYVKHLETKIILISGKELAELMWEKNIGLNTIATYEIKKIDDDYFEG